jgi:Ala-tRNA(Pro) deacylase
VVSVAATRLREFLDEQGVSYDLREHDREVAAQRLAATEHVSGWIVAKPVLIWAGGKLVMGVVPGPLRIDLERVKASLEVESARLAEETEFAAAFPDCEVGAEPPFGNLYDVPVYVDRRLLQASKVVCRAGSHTASVTLDTSDYLRVVNPIEADLAAD